MILFGRLISSCWHVTKLIATVVGNEKVVKLFGYHIYQLTKGNSLIRIRGNCVDRYIPAMHCEGE